MPPTPLHTVLASLNRIILGKPRVLQLAMTCLLARGHLLIEDIPGVGKTTLAHALSHLLGLQFQRTQFTSDLLPADIIGVSVFERETERFRFHPGPVFAQVLLADEINRATPKTQSALLEAMEERQVTADGATYPLPTPFFVIATQNPTSQIGTFPLPESQLDRFLMRLSLGYPDAAAERALLEGRDRRDIIGQLPSQLSPEALSTCQEAVLDIHTSPGLLDYLQALITRSRQFAGSHGLSPRAGLALLQASRAWCYLDGRDSVLPEDVQAVFGAVAGHRLAATDAVEQGPVNAILESVPLP